MVIFVCEPGNTLMYQVIFESTCSQQCEIIQKTNHLYVKCVQNLKPLVFKNSNEYCKTETTIVFRRQNYFRNHLIFIWIKKKIFFCWPVLYKAPTGRVVFKYTNTKLYTTIRTRNSNAIKQKKCAGLAYFRARFISKSENRLKTQLNEI